MIKNVFYYTIIGILTAMQIALVLFVLAVIVGIGMALHASALGWAIIGLFCFGAFLIGKKFTGFLIS